MSSWWTVNGLIFWWFLSYILIYKKYNVYFSFNFCWFFQKMLIFQLFFNKVPFGSGAPMNLCCSLKSLYGQRTLFLLKEHHFKLVSKYAPLMGCCGTRLNKRQVREGAKNCCGGGCGHFGACALLRRLVILCTACNRCKSNP